MAFKKFYLTLCMCFFLFIVVKGSCLEYGHSCWGAHGKRSGNNKIYYKDIKTPESEVDFQQTNGLSEKNTYASSEEQNGFTDLAPSSHDMIKANDDRMETSDQNLIKYKNFLYKKRNKTGKEKQRNFEFPEYHMKKSNSRPIISERWQRLPLYNLKRIQIARPENDWFRELEQEQQINEVDYA